MKHNKIIILLVLFCLGLGGFGYYRYDQFKRKKAYETAKENLALSFNDADQLKKSDAYRDSKENELILEYGTGTFSCSDLIENFAAESITMEPEKVDLSQTGDTDVSFVITAHDEYGVEVDKEYTYNVKVVDTISPVIEIARIWGYFKAGEDPDLESYVGKVYDLVDGELSYSETLKAGTYTIDRSEFIEDAAGTYFLMVCAKDKNGNESYNGFKVTVAGGREQSDEEVLRLSEIYDDYSKTDLDTGVSYETVNKLPEYDVSALNGLWNSAEDEEYKYMNFEIDYPRVYNWGPLEATIRKNEDISNDYGFVFDEGTEEETTIGFRLTDEDSGVLYITDEQGNIQIYREVFRLNDDFTVVQQPTRRKARMKVEVAATHVLNEEVTRMEEEQRRRQEEARKKAEAAAAAAKAEQESQSSGGNSSGSSSQNVDVSGYVSQVLSIVNEERSSAGLPELSMTSELNAAAQRRAEELVSLYSHSRPDGSSCFTVLDEYGISPGTSGENIAAGYGSASAVMSGWMNSDGHRANILRDSFSHIGIGCVYVPGSEYGIYWVQLFTD